MALVMNFYMALLTSLPPKKNLCKEEFCLRKQTSTAFLLCILYDFCWMMITF
jgi:hypothetical protein